MPTITYSPLIDSPLIETASTLDGLGRDVQWAEDQVANLRALVSKLTTAPLAEASRLVGELDYVSEDLGNAVQTVATVVRRVDNGHEYRNRGTHADDAQLVDAVLDVERGLGTWDDVVALARKLA
jgi:hypothetical protein